MRWKIPVQEVGSMNGDLYGVKKTKNRVAVMTNFGGGSPMVAELAEEYAVMGAKRLVLMTWGGALQPDLKAGDIVVCDRAIRDDGASHHYLPAEKYISASSELVDCLVRAIRARGAGCTAGTTWTTDAPYRETLEEVQQYQAERSKNGGNGIGRAVHRRADARGGDGIRRRGDGQPGDLPLAGARTVGRDPAARWKSSIPRRSKCWQLHYKGSDVLLCLSALPYAFMASRAGPNGSALRTG